MIGRSVHARWVALLLVPLVAACQPKPVSQSAMAESTGVQVTPATSAPEPAIATPAAVPAAANPAAAPGDADAIIAENDRAIAENRRIAKTLDGYRRTDNTKLDRLKSGCEKTLGAATDRDGAKRIFDCVEAGW